MKNSFVMYIDHMEQIELLTMEQRGILLTALMQYAAGQGLPELDPITNMAFSFIKSRMDKDLKKYEEVVNKRREAGRRGGIAKAENARQNVAEPDTEHQTLANADKGQQTVANAKSAKQMVANVPDSEYVNDNDKKERHLKVSKEKFVPPTVEEVQEYCLKSGYTVDAEKFIDFYVSKGWMVGKNKMKDWKAAVRNWSRGRQQAAPAKVITNRFNNFRQRDYDYDALEQQLLEC